jgi:hypothetical protein
MAYDYSEAPPSRDFDLIPNGTVATVQMTIRAGGAGEGALLKRSKDGACEMLNCEFTVIDDGPNKKRRFWENMILDGISDGHRKAAEISRGKLRAILESARDIRPDDTSPEARARRTVELREFDGMRFIAKIGIEKGGAKNDGSGENFADRNVLLGIVGPDKREWHKVDQPEPPPFNGGGARAPEAPAPGASTPIISKPTWAS